MSLTMLEIILIVDVALTEATPPSIEVLRDTLIAELKDLPSIEETLELEPHSQAASPWVMLVRPTAHTAGLRREYAWRFG